MATAEQPLKKRKLYEPSPPSSPPPQPPPPPEESLPQPPQSPPTPPPLSQEEILRRRRAQEEIRNVFECYKRINFCISQKDKRFMPELEQAYHSLISASRGGRSVQRLVAEYLPRYASYFPTALEAAVKAVIDMHNWSFKALSHGEEGDGISFEISKACILGLVDICQAAAFEAPTSAVPQGISSAVFLNVFTFFASSFEGKDIFQIVGKEILKIHEAQGSYVEIQRELLEEANSTLFKLSKLQVLSFLRILFCCPKNSIVACFEFFKATGKEGPKYGSYFLNQLTNELDYVDDFVRCVENKSSIGSNAKLRRPTDDGHGSDNNSPSNTSRLLKNCLLRLVLGKDSSFKNLIFSKYRKIRECASFEVVSSVTSVLEAVFESFSQLVDGENCQIDGSVGISVSSKYPSQLPMSRMSGLQGSPSVVAGREFTEKCSSTTLMRNDSLDGGESRPMDFQYSDLGDLSNSRTLMPRDMLSRQSFSPVERTPRDFRSNSFNGRNHTVDRSPVSNMELSSPASGAASSPFVSPKNNLPPAPPINHALCYSDGDPASMDIFLASKQLWLGSLGPDASEMSIRFQFEKFGPIDQLRYFPFKGFATIEYRNIMDAIKAREVMRSCSPWGACLRIKFLDTELGARGAINGTAVGSSCHVYVGNVSSNWAKDEMINEVSKILHKGPRMFIDLTGEGALLMEFDSPEEATIAIAHLRWHRSRNFIPSPSNKGPTNIMMHQDSARLASPPVVDTRSTFSAYSNIGMPHGPSTLEKFCDGYPSRTSKLSSLLFQLRSKYNLNHCQSPFENHSGTSLRDLEQGQTNSLRISVPSISISCISDDELLAVCNLAMNNTGSVVLLSRTTLPTGSYWLVECSSIVAANTLLKRLRDCPETFFQIEFCNSGKPYFATLPSRSDSSPLELASPRITHGNQRHVFQQTGHTFQSSWTGGGMADVGRTGAPEHSWLYGRSETAMHGGQGSIVAPSIPPQGLPVGPMPPVQSPSPFRPVCAPPVSMWDAHGFGHFLPPNPVPSGVMPANPTANLQTPPFLPASVTPLSQIQGGSVAPCDKMFSLPVVPPPLSSLPPPPSNLPPPFPLQPDFRPPMPPMPPPPPPPPPPHSQPPAYPPPPSSPPPPPPPPLPSDSADSESSKLCQDYVWQGILSKSGVFYCMIRAQRVESDICNYSGVVSEPAEWPAKLDMTKRTDLRHVKSTFSSTPSHRREICWLLPSSHGDHKGLQDFITYLKQRDCAGVIKIPATKSMWSRLLFILPCSPDTCTLLSLPPNPPLCLVGLVLPKETNSEL